MLLSELVLFREGSTVLFTDLIIYSSNTPETLQPYGDYSQDEGVRKYENT